MNTPTYWFCCLVMQLNRIPRYGRLYRLLPDTDDSDGPVLGPPRWTWQWRGFWGIYLLDRMELFWPYTDEYERRNPDACSRSVVGRTDD